MRQASFGLKTFVYRVLLLRLLATGALIALLFGTLAYLNGRDRIQEQVYAGALTRLELTKTEVERILGTDSTALTGAIEQALQTSQPLHGDARYGRFVYARISGPGLDHVVQQSTGDLPVETQAFIRQLAMPQDPTLQTEVQTRHIGERSYIYLLLPNPGRADRAVTFVQGLFELSEAALEQIHRRVLETVLYVVGIVAVTTALLYPVILHLVRRMARFSEELLDSNLETLQVLGSAIAKKDSDTDAHNYRVTLYSLHLARDLGLDEAATRRLIKGAFLHDVGKIGIRDAVLLKPGRLDAEEFAVMRTHVNHGLDIIDRSNWLEDAAGVVGGHHEKYGGGGYPNNLRGEAIPLEARIFAIADVFDALTSQRPYKEPFSLEKSLEILDQGRGQHFDPQLLEQFRVLAPGLHAKYAGREDDGLQQELNQWTRRYFSAGLEGLGY